MLSTVDPSCSGCFRRLVDAKTPGLLPSYVSTFLLTLVGLCVAAALPGSAALGAEEELWSLRPVVRPNVPTVEVSGSPAAPIDAFLEQARRERSLTALPRADRATLLRRVYLDLIGLPPRPEELEAFLSDSAPSSPAALEAAYERVVAQLLASEQHGVRYARHWLDVLRYADVDDRMRAESGIFRWRDWVIDALNADRPYDEFVRAQIAGDLMPGGGDLSATGFLARGANRGAHSMSFAATETISTAFMAMTLGCAKCHDHMYDPLTQADYYATKALFDPLVLRSEVVASQEEVAAHTQRENAYERARHAITEPMEKLIAPFKKRLFDERVETLPPDVQAIIRKPAAQRSADEAKVASDYAPILRIDPPKIREIMKPEEAAAYKSYLDRLRELKPPPALPVRWRVEIDPKRAKQKSYIFALGEPGSRLDAVDPGYPFASTPLDRQASPRQQFLDWLTAPSNPLFARVAVNRIWQWHFGVGLVETASDFGRFGKQPSHPELLDWLAAEFIAGGFSMKKLHRLIVTSKAYQLASAGAGDAEVVAANRKQDPGNAFLWSFRLRRLEAESIRDSLLYAAGELDLSVGGKSFRMFDEQRRLGSKKVIGNFDLRVHRRTIYMARGYHPDRELLPAFLSTFDAEDGQFPCARREETITAPQALFFLNSELAHGAAQEIGGKLERLCGDDLERAVRLAYQRLLARHPSASERKIALEFLSGEASRLAELAWLLANLDEFVFLR